MIKIDKPNLDQGTIIDECIENMRAGIRKERISLSKEIIIQKEEEYDSLAKKAELYKVSIHSKVVENGADTDDMKVLYEQKFVPENQAGRKYYDIIMHLAPRGKCPYCGQRIANTLDHYLPKSKYPTYAVTPYNLVPSCSDCNKEKSTDSYDSKESQTIHPYYDDFTDEVWIKAKLIEAELSEEEPIIFEFYVGNPEAWDVVKCKRAERHFDDYGLNELYRVYASDEYIACENRIKRNYSKGGKDLAIDHLQEMIEDRMCIRKNSWQAAMYQAIIESEWYWDEYMPAKIMNEMSGGKASNIND